jgi:hypothetical protein
VMTRRSPTAFHHKCWICKGKGPQKVWRGELGNASLRLLSRARCATEVIAKLAVPWDTRLHGPPLFPRLVTRGLYGRSTFSCNTVGLWSQKGDLMAVALSPQFPGSFNKATHQVWWIWVALLIEAVGLLLVAGLLLTAAPRSEKERCYGETTGEPVVAAAGWLMAQASRRISGSSLIRRIRAELREIGSGPPADPTSTESLCLGAVALRPASLFGRCVPGPADRPRCLNALRKGARQAQTRNPLVKLASTA